jgi:hypothetical protein
MSMDFLPWMLVLSLPGSPSHFFWDVHKFWCCKIVSGQITAQNRGMWKISMSIQLHEILCTNSQDVTASVV